MRENNLSTVGLFTGYLLCAIAAPALAQTTLPFTDDFQSSTLNPAWQQLPGSGSISVGGGQLVYSNAGQLASTTGWNSAALTLALPFTGTNWIIETNATYNLDWACLGSTYTGPPVPYTGCSSGAQGPEVLVSFNPGTVPGPAAGPNYAGTDFAVIERVIDAFYGSDLISASYGTASINFVNPVDATIQNNIAGGTYWYKIIRNGGTLTIMYSSDGANYLTALTTQLANPLSTVNELLLGGITYQTAGSFTNYGPISISPLGSPQVTTASLPAAAIGTPYTQTLQAAGGATPYTWSISSGSLPPGLNLSDVGVISGTPTTSGTFSFTVSVSDANLVAATSSLSIMILPQPALTFTGPATVAPGDQPVLNFRLGQAYPVDLSGILTLTVQPDSRIGVDDPNIQFSTGGRTLSFTLAAGATSVPVVQFQAGTVAASITVELQLAANGINVTPTNVQPVVVGVPAANPTITSGAITRSGDTLTVTLQGYSSTRDMTQATFTFLAAAGETISDPTVTVPLSSAFTSWYQNSQSDLYGSSFSFSQAFTVSQDSAKISSVSVTLSNSIGTSNASTLQ